MSFLKLQNFLSIPNLLVCMMNIPYAFIEMGMCYLLSSLIMKNDIDFQMLTQACILRMYFTWSQYIIIFIH